jgi:hypothetical protein
MNDQGYTHELLAGFVGGIIVNILGSSTRIDSIKLRFVARRWNIQVHTPLLGVKDHTDTRFVAYLLCFTKSSSACF